MKMNYILFLTFGVAIGNSPLAAMENNNTGNNKIENELLLKENDNSKKDLSSDFFYNVPSTSVNTLLENGLKTTGTKEITGNLVNGGNVIIKIYGVAPKLYQGTNIYHYGGLFSGELKEEYTKFKSSEYMQHAGYGCGLHSIKNDIYFTKALLQSSETGINESIEDMKKLHVFDGNRIDDKTETTTTYSEETWSQPWKKDSLGKENWITVWNKGKSFSNNKKSWFDSPPARFKDAKRLIKSIINHTAFAPQGSESILSHTLILGDVNQSKLHSETLEKIKNINHEKTDTNDYAIWANGIQKLKDVITKTIDDPKTTFIAPILVYYSYAEDCNKKVCRHWVSVIFRKIETGVLEAFITDSQKSKPLEENSNKKIIGTILNEIGLIPSWKILPKPEMNK